MIPLAVSLLLLIRLGFAVFSLFRLRAAARPAPAEWQDLVDQQRRRLGISRSVRLAISPSLAVPVTFGWLRPVVLLPEAASGWAEEPLREALVHELSHVRRGDWAIQMIARAACVVHWLDPFVWLLCRRLLLEAELACDDQVLRAGAGAEGYAERLVALARQVRGSARLPVSAVAFGRPTELASRVAAILDSGRRRGGPGRLTMAGASAVALLLLLLLAPAHLVRAEPERLAEPDSIRDGIAGAVAQPAEVSAEAVEQGVSGALDDEDDEAIEDGVREGAGAGKREALVAAAEKTENPAAGSAVQSDVHPDIAVPGDGAPLTAASRKYAETLHRILMGSLFESPVRGEGC